jgi:phenylalanyl-tRNA synthetase alpha subunit
VVAGCVSQVVTLFGDVERRWIDTYFPFTDPSFELEIYYNVSQAAPVWWLALCSRMAW